METTTKVTHLSTDKELGKKVNKAAKLARKCKELCTSLDALKAEIRLEAERLASKHKADRVDIESESGTCMVTFPKDKTFIVKGSTPEDLQSVLTPAQFDAIFKVEVSLNTATAFATWQNLSTVEKRAVDRVLDTCPSTPAVTLPR